MTTEPLIRNISDTALWVAVYRAWETEQANPVFRDPYARRLAGERGEEIMAKIKVAHRHAWSYTARTYNIDSFVTQEIANGADMVIDLAAGLDTRPYRMQLPSALQWIEIELPELLTYKDKILQGEKPVCRLERIPLDLANAVARRVLFEELGRAAKRAVVISEGLIVYLTAAEVCNLARDLAAPSSFQRWATDLCSPRLLTMLQKQVGSQLDQAGSPLKFAPEQGPAFFNDCGWTPIDVRSMLQTAAELKRLPLLMRLFALFPDSKGTKPKQIWGGVVQLEKK
ncbi:MAG TPA: SAM-dependent methyltransferase [Thermoanaerobaculia bacterium]|jgi:methyltransferase (TIGR00027 family)|nr:SAM-dependent methyltransferase [Thermoanaerobaculia bacterium]